MDLSLPCSEQSLRAGEPLAGTALSEVDVWLLLEHPGKWEADIADTPLPEATRAWLDRIQHQIPKSKLLFIRRDRPVRSLSFFLAVSNPARAVYRFAVQQHEQLAQLDLSAVLEGGSKAAEAQGGERTQALYLVCTHGKRDACCARKGTAFYRALEQAELDGELWQSSHQGGHRFAATMLYLPYGLHYGRLEPAHAKGLARAHADGLIYDLARYRGLTSLPMPQQAAEAWLRDQLDELRIDGLSYAGDGELDDDERCDARFSARDGSRHRVVMADREGKEMRKTSCSADAPAPFAYYQVVRYESSS